MLELRRHLLVVVGDDDRPDPLRDLVDQQGSRRLERLQVFEPAPEIVERRRRLVEAPEDDADDHSSGSAQGS